MRKNLTLLLLLLSVTSCIRTKRLIYFQDTNQTAKFRENAPTLLESSRTVYRLQPNDVLSIKVQSTQPEISGIFNLGSGVGGQMFADPANLFLSSFSLNDKGKVTMPTVGEVALGNLTIDEAQVLVQGKIDEYLNGATVIVKLVSFKITVLGEVTRPGYYYVYNGQATLLEGLGLAGDLNLVANRRNLKLIRQTDRGTEITLLNLTDPSLVRSKYYYLQPNDVIYVEPQRAQINRGNASNLNIVFSGISAVALIVGLFITRR